MEKVKPELYRLMDSFLVESDKPRPIERLNLDRHLFVENVVALIIRVTDEVIGEDDIVTDEHGTEHEQILLALNFQKRYQRIKRDELVKK